MQWKVPRSQANFLTQDTDIAPSSQTLFSMETLATIAINRLPEH
jgi:hypothetical protein